MGRKFVLIFVLGFCASALGRVDEVKLEKIEFSPGSEEVFTFDYTMTEINKTAFAISATYTQKVDMDNDWKMEMVLSMGDDMGNFIEIFRSDPMGVCDMAMQAKEKGMPKFNDEESNMPDPSICPRPKGTYNIQRDVVNFEPMFAAAMPGHFKVDMILKHMGVEKSVSSLHFVMS